MSVVPRTRGAPQHYGRSALVAQAPAGGAQTGERGRPEAAPRAAAVRERRALPDERGRDGQHELVDQVGLEQLPRERAAADEPCPHAAALADQPDELGEVARVALDGGARALELLQLAGVRDDPGGLVAVGPAAVADHEPPRLGAHDQRVDVDEEGLVVVLGARERLEEGEIVVGPGDAAVEARGGEVDDAGGHGPTIARGKGACVGTTQAPFGPRSGVGGERLVLEQHKLSTIGR